MCVDEIELEVGDSYIFDYTSVSPSNSSDHTIANYTGPCFSATDIPANVPLKLLSIFITISDENTGEGIYFKPVCNQLVLYDQSLVNLYDVMRFISDQVPLDISVVLDPSTKSIMTLNNITNRIGYQWTPFNVKTKKTLPRDLWGISPSDGDQIRFDFVNVGGDDIHQQKSGVKSLKTTMSVLLFLSSIFLSLYM
ncbi:uncharacterized protein LOC121421821 [Lytechinus variegatus]|uniref:uncharacterized protein LOC121421821 n=1 Tax=Lytechinus variegatus TaxID=7654 RepID=UPI001BB1CC4E|nr:uncharacterized protein LOC121421821 [Lytechinus variegatus]